MYINSKTILVAEDEETDRFILNRAFQKTSCQHRLVMVTHGKECVDYLNGVPPFDNRETHPMPALLILDLKMPVMDGFEVLTWLAARPELEHIPALVLSSSSDDSDILRARQLGARDYFVKPLMLPDLVEILVGIQKKWLD